MILIFFLCYCNSLTFWIIVNQGDSEDRQMDHSGGWFRLSDRLETRTILTLKKFFLLKSNFSTVKDRPLSLRTNTYQENSCLCQIYRIKKKKKNFHVQKQLFQNYISISFNFRLASQVFNLQAKIWHCSYY